MMRITLPVVAALLLLVPAAPAQQTAPAAQEVLARHLQAIGGPDAVARITSRWTWGRFEIAAQGLNGPFLNVAAAPNRSWTRIEITGLGEVLSGFDGTTAWSINPAVGPMILTGRALEQSRHQAEFHAVLNPENWIETMTVAGPADFEGHPCWELRIKLKTGEEYTEYYSRESGLLTGSVRTQASPMGDFPATTLYSDYRAHDGVHSPMRILVKAMGFEQAVILDSISVRPVPDSMFALPAEIKALQPD